ncbi:type VI secretion system baseplate subunit TssK [Sessilibacter sp. MAH2]
MAASNKVIWTEGMFLRPQHFQQQNRYTERFIHQKTGSIENFPWGFTELSLESDALAQGKLAISSMSGIFPDGTPFNAPDNDPLPPTIDIPENISDVIVYLCIPLERDGFLESEWNDQESSLARFASYNFDARNNTTESGEAARIQVGRLKTQVKLSSEDLSGYSTLPLAYIQESTPESPIKLDRGFIPPLLACSASSVVVSYLEEVKGLLNKRGEALGHRLADSGRSGSAEIADYLLLQVVNRVEPLIDCLHNLPRLHPFELYQNLVQLNGELSTFTASSKRPAPLPRYKHGDLKTTFLNVITPLRQCLSMVLEQNAISLELVERKFGMHVAPLTDRSLISTAFFVVAVKADMPTEELRVRFPSQAKIGPVEVIRSLVSTQLPGIALSPLPVAPRQIPFHTGFVYFELQRGTDLWKSMAKSGGFAIHIGANFPGLIMELWAVRNS